MIIDQKVGNPPTIIITLTLNITLTNTGKRYNREWIFRKFNYDFIAGKSYAITGINGSGKSTLLQVIGGAIMHSEGKIDYANPTTGNQQPTTESAFRNISIAAPYLELIEEMTAKEMLSFHTTFKKLKYPAAQILAAVGLEKAADKQIRYFSSGMKQRLKLAQAFFSDTSVLLLDEPVTNLDEEGIAVYKKLLQENTAGRLVIVSSNDKQEYDFCDEVIAIADYK
jgi:ABC-type multidrug transport system ATPase subunit